MVSATGTIVAMEAKPGAVWRIELDVEPDGRALLAAGQELLVCELPATYEDRRSRFEDVLQSLSVGKRVEVSGYFVADDGEGGIHKIRPWTALDPFPDR